MTPLRRALLTVFLVSLVIFVCVPILFVLITSFNAKGIFPIRSGYEFSLQWYRGLPANFFRGFKISLIVGCASTLIAIGPGIMAAFAIARGSFRGKQLLGNIFLSPLVLPLIVLGVSFYRYFTLVSDFTGLPLLDSYWGLILAHAGFTWAYVIRAVVAGLENFDLELEHAAADLGAGLWYRLLHVTLPTIRPSIIGGVIFAFLISFDDVPVSLFLYGSETTPLPIELMNYMEDQIDPYITAMSTLTVAFSVALMLVVERTIGMRRLVGLPEEA